MIGIGITAVGAAVACAYAGLVSGGWRRVSALAGAGLAVVVLTILVMTHVGLVGLVGAMWPRAGTGLRMLGLAGTAASVVCLLIAALGRDGRRWAAAVAAIVCLVGGPVIGPGRAPARAEPERIAVPITVHVPITRDTRTLEDIVHERGHPWPIRNPRIVVVKSRFELMLYDGDVLLKTYPVALGPDPVTDKRREGDGRTPEGEFYVCQKASGSGLSDPYLGSWWLRLSYPGPAAADRGMADGLITRLEHAAVHAAFARLAIPPQHTALGGGIGIHGGWDLVASGRTWTGGCVGMFDHDAGEIYAIAVIGTPVVITR